jgi:CubicO group peptidase (beta-lactamase class C family)
MSTCKITIRGIVCCTLFSCIFIIKNFAQELPVPHTIEELKQQLSNEMNKQHVPGMMLTLVTRDSVLFAGGIGFANLERKIPVNENHLFRQASIGKLFVALGILNLIKDGKLSADTKLRDLAPEVPFKNKWEATNPITIAELMEHSTGFSDKSPFEEYNFSDKKFPGLEALNVFKKFMVSKWQPAQNHSYSNVNYIILGYLVEKISGKSLNDYLHEKIFIPLSMSSSNMTLRDDGTDIYSKGYVWKENHFQPVPHAPQYSAANGSLNACAIDYAHALRAFLVNWQTPSGQFLSKEILDDSEIPHTYLSAKTGFKNSYAYGNECRDIEGQIFRGHMGAISSYLSAFLYNRKAGMGFALSINTSNESFVMYAQELVCRYLMQYLPKPVVPAAYPVNAIAIKPYLGYYRWSNPAQLYSGFFDGLQNTFKLTQQGNALDVHIIGRGSMKWQAADSTGVLYKYENGINPRIVFLKDFDQQTAITDGTMYFTKISALEAWVPIVLFAGSCLILLSTLIFGFISLLLLIFKKDLRTQWLFRIAPLLTTVGLIIIIIVIPRLLEHLKSAASMDILFIWWTAGKYIFAFFSVAALFLLLLRWKKLKNNWLKFYLSLTAFASCYLLGVLLVNHWY